MPEAAQTPRLIAIAGGSGSGKTTLARAVAGLLSGRCALIEHDAYYRCLAHLPPERRAAANFDHPDSLDNALLVRHLLELRGGRTVRQPLYDFATHSRLPDTRDVSPCPFVLVDGILVLSSPALANAFDLRVFVDAPPEVRFVRRCERDVHERGRTPQSVREQWRTSVQPMHERFVEPIRSRCDLVLPGTADVASNARRIVDAVTAGAAAHG